MHQDETMSEEVAFTPENNDSQEFKFDGVETSDSPASLAETDTTEESVETDSSTSEDKEEDVSSDEEQRVPYSRFKAKYDEANELAQRLQYLEGQLSVIQSTKSESTEEGEPMPPEWIKLYGDSDASKEAWQIQQTREKQIAERAVRQAMETIEKQQEEFDSRLAENENALDESLGNLEQSIGKKLTTKQQEAILSIVDEFSPVDDSGHYVSLFPFDKAYEIYELRAAKAGQATKMARRSVADLTNGSSESEVDSHNSKTAESWDSWRSAV